MRAQLGHVHAHGGERRRDVARDRNIVEPGQRDIVGNPQSTLGQGEQAAQRHHVVGGEHRVGPLGSLQQHLSGLMSGRFAEVAGEYPRFGGRIGFQDRVAIAAQALEGIEVVGRAGNERDPAMTGCEQMRHHRPRPAVVVDAERDVFGLGRLRIDQNRRQRGEVFAEEIDIAHVRRHHQQAIDPAAHRTQGGRLFLGMAVIARHQQVQAAVAGDEVDTTDQFGKEFTVQIGQHHADGVGAAAAETARGVVRAVAQLGRDRQHPAAHGFGHVVVPVDGPRDRGHRNLRDTRHIFDRHAQCIRPAFMEGTGRAAAM